MARHRNVRSMNYSDEYDGYDDVYGHSVEDDICVSPSEAGFMYDREGSKNQQIGAFIKDIAEEDEHEFQVPEIEQAKLESCMAQLKLVLGSSTSKQEMTKVLCNNDLNVDKALNILLDNASMQQKQTEKKEKDVNLFKKSNKQFNIPKLNSFSSTRLNGDSTLNENMSNLHLRTSNVNTTENSQFASLSDLSTNHLKKLNFGRPKFNVEKISNLSLKMSDVKSLNEETAIDTLADQSYSHSKNIKNFCIPKFRKENLSDNTFNKIDTKMLNEKKIDKGVNFLVDSRQSNCNKNLQQNIDLTKALTRNVSQKAVTTNNKKCNYLDITCTKKSSNAFNCTMDITSILETSPTISKKVSAFGKILCCKYKKFVPLIINDAQTRRTSKFSFNVLSPDDMILSYLKKK